jgi:hypothetical protein
MLGSMIHHKSYSETGDNAEKIGITGLSIEEIKALVE